MPNASFYARLAKLSSIVLMLPSSMAAGWILGHYLVDRFLPTYPWGSIGLTLVGAGAGFYEIVKILLADQRSKDD
jgi:F0F1-type ATP synthase assembly protein I